MPESTEESRQVRETRREMGHTREIDRERDRRHRTMSIITVRKVDTYGRAKERTLKGMHDQKRWTARGRVVCMSEKCIETSEESKTI